MQREFRFNINSKSQPSQKNELSEQGVLNQDSKIDFLKDIKQESNDISDSEMFENNLIVDCMESEKIRTLENIIQCDEQIWKNTLHMEEKRIEKLYKELNYEIKNNIKCQKELNQLKRQTKSLNHNNMHIVGNDDSRSNLHSNRDHKNIHESANHPDTKNEENKQSKKQKHRKTKTNKNNIVKMKKQSISEENEVDEDDEEDKEKEKEMASNKYFRFYGFIQAFQNKLKSIEFKVLAMLVLLFVLLILVCTNSPPKTNGKTKNSFEINLLKTFI